ncbi:MAG: hypothetical protein AAF629_16540 [Chloroflexota bacterium]
MRFTQVTGHYLDKETRHIYLYSPETSPIQPSSTEQRGCVRSFRQRNGTTKITKSAKKKQDNLCDLGVLCGSFLGLRQSLAMPIPPPVKPIASCSTCSENIAGQPKSDVGSFYPPLSPGEKNKNAMAVQATLWHVLGRPLPHLSQPSVYLK